ncbi:MAG: UDP-N-acetylmuramate dehydrogenase [Actinobacteria bacterium]|nr:UDP-N-acetylmuramate dehydrogenase [Actinomycetota bacterium]NIS36948.1 UDP-N-acetylmuramate dehydrogenase [Actinomycetota bacterium]NIT98462.1 UDP-N-acetylmuramate dehydrogenase [Actinomycetota bacterium]NIU22071.1 UDP-N-acetylmuramate dehydrogenase [Actinomycetota bacterium]NIU70565.1 UDP-N-acetylmuramate dehydrogenase [Actinomycetota bacterium]
MTARTRLDEALDRLRDGPLVSRTRFDEPLGPLTTYRVGGAAAALVTVENEGDLDALGSLIAATGVVVVPLGRGSNLLVADAGFAGLAVLLGGGFAAIGVDGTTVTAGAAAKLPVVARTTVQQGLTGFEWAVGVPGSVGGAVRMNAGGHGAEMRDSLSAADVLDLRTGSRRWWTPDELDFGYRRSAITATDLVLAARLELSPGDRDAGRAELAEIVQWRRENQPGGQNAGSVFTNPEGDSAGRLIEAAGAKGLRIGTAEVSAKHANFIQADEGGRAADVLSVMTEVRRRVEEKCGVTLHPETHLLGFGDPEDPFANPFDPPPEDRP